MFLKRPPGKVYWILLCKNQVYVFCFLVDFFFFFVSIDIHIPCMTSARLPLLIFSRWEFFKNLFHIWWRSFLLQDPGQVQLEKLNFIEYAHTWPFNDFDHFYIPESLSGFNEISIISELMKLAYKHKRDKSCVGSLFWSRPAEGSPILRFS